jgi:hypothetical protein
VLTYIRQSEVCPADQVTSLEELGYGADLADEKWIQDLGGKGGHIVVTRDGNIMNATVRRNAWVSSSLGIILLDKKWGSLPRRELLRHLLYWWPHMTKTALDGAPGAAWTVSCRIADPHKRWIRPVTVPEVSAP